MKLSRTARNHRARRMARRAAPRRRAGSTLLVVVALMGMLSLLGVMFFAFATQEEENAKNFHEAAKYIHDPELGPDVYFDWALRQLSNGPEDYEKQSALWGRHMSLLPNAYGSDAHPHSGSGMQLRQSATYNMAGQLTNLSEPFVDLNGDGAGDFIDLNGNGSFDANDKDLRNINRSPAANVIVPGGGNPNIAFEIRRDLFPEPDVDYTYPDINNVFLAHIGWVLVVEDLNGNGALDAGEPDYDGDGAVTAPMRVRVVKPSFLRPELLQRVESSVSGSSNNEDANGDGVWDPATEDANGNGFFDATDFNRDGNQDDIARLDPTWYWSSWSTSRILRPHPGHYFVPPAPAPGQPPPPPTVFRFLNDSNPTDAGIIAALPGGSKGFPFNGRRDPANQNTTYPLRYGIWKGYKQTEAQPPVTPTSNRVSVHEFDEDADGDGIYEAVLLDLAFPVQERPSDGALYVPMFAITVYDADGLINLSTAGNLSGDTSPPGATGFFGNGLGQALPNAQSASISKSSAGVTPFEVNPLWALDGDQSLETQLATFLATNTDYAQYFGRTFGPGEPTRWELANMELWWSKKGRVEYGGSLPEVHAGFFGESNRVWNVLQAAGSNPPINMNVPNNFGSFGPASNLFPFPGVWNQDDNRNGNTGGATNVAFGQTLAFQHPLSVSGRGRFTTVGSPKQLILVQPLGATNPSRWIGYLDYDVAGVPQWSLHVGNQLMQGTRFGQLDRGAGADLTFGTQDDVLVDDLTEMILEPKSYQRPYDEALAVSDSALLHLSKTDIDNTGVWSRLRDLMPGNIDPNNSSITANDRRRRFTTSSWDRKQFGFPRILGPGADGAPGTVNVDDNRNGVKDDPGELGWPATDDVRAWEFNFDADGDNLPEFPPEFPGIIAYAGMRPNRPHPVDANFNPLGRLSPTPQDPFRTELRRLLEVEFGNRNELRLQFKLSINEVLDVVRNQNSPGHPFYSPLEFRPLTPHSTDVNLTTASIPVVTPGGALPTWPPQNEGQKEFWARYDRQRLARDIYVMLYTFCGGNETINYATTAGASAYPSDPTGPVASQSLREMAQFAVNVVDSMDRDNVMTVFEYDTDLSDGWDLDDQAGTTAESDRAEVVGVEAQQLTLSETLWVFQPELMNDNQYTPFDESNPPASTGPGADGYYFFYTELRSASPQSVQLAKPNISSSAANGVWRLRWKNTNNPIDDDTSGSDDDIEPIDRNVTPPVGNGLVFRANGANADAIAPGDLFTIATSNNTSPDSSDLFVDYNASSGGFELIAPKFGTTTTSVPSNNPTGLTPNANGATGLDLVHTQNQNQNRFILLNGSTGDFMSPTYSPSSDAILVLERRANPDLPQLSLAQNPWIVVDYTAFRKRQFLADNGTAPTQADTTTALANLQSHQRKQPLSAKPYANPANHEDDYASVIDPNRTNSFMGNNEFNNPPVTQFDVIQPHFDRDFSSIIELFSVSLKGPKYLTRHVQSGSENPYSQNTLYQDDPADTDEGDGASSAAARFLQPIHPLSSVANPRNNHWHRLLGFVEVPTRMHQQLGGAFQTTRVPGKINLNTIRHPEVLAALLDDPELYFPTSYTQDANGDGVFDFGLPGLTGVLNPNDVSRDWWFDLIRSRDGTQPETRLTLPGMAAVMRTFPSGVTFQVGGSRPFRDLGYMSSTFGLAPLGAANLPDPRAPIEQTMLRTHPNGLTTPSMRGLFDLGTPGDVNGNSLKDFVRLKLLSKIAGNTTTRSNVFFVFVSVQFHEAYEDPTTGSIRVGGRIDLNSDGVRDDGHRGFFILDRSDAEEAYDHNTGTFNWKELVKYRLTIN